MMNVYQFRRLPERREGLDELSEVRARLAAYEMQIGQLSEMLSEMHTR
jgi:hypothetical protein